MCSGYDYLQNCIKFGTKQGNTIIKLFLEQLHNPQDNLNIIHVAGTNGKGSTCLLLNNILVKSGYKVGLFTSPHLTDFTERFQINNIPISKEEFDTQINVVSNISKKYLKENKFLSFFELLTIICFNYFFQNKVDFLILEVGIGGKFDSTNIIKKTILSIITSISFDHMNLLGKRLDQIALQKAGIIKKNCDVILYLQTNNIYNKINGVCKKRKSKLFYLGDKLSVKISMQDVNCTVFSCSHRFFNYNNLTLKLLGKHQVFNAINVLIAVYALKRKKILISDEAIRYAMLNTTFHGRMEFVKFCNKNILFDGAHNYDGIVKLVSNFELYFKTKKIILVIGILETKQFVKMLDFISKHVNFIILTNPDTKKNSKISYISKYISNLDVCILEDCKTAIQYALNLSSSQKIICVCGSLYLISNIKKYLFSAQINL